MLTELADPSPTLYVILGAIAVVLGAIAFRRQKRSDVINFAIAAMVLLALFLIDLAVESPREQIFKSIQEMETATQNKKHADVFKHVSDSFKYRSWDKKGLQEKAQLVEVLPNWEGIKVLGLNRKGFDKKDTTTAEQRFEVQPLRMPGTEYRYDCIATFKKEGDQWRLIGFRLEKDGKEVTPPGL
ncbi:MAG TPA: hypothetical protein VKD90_06595 [Gemmataceae bacterium]|nr:hypothetical protein [Gemmataceae bacterium]